MNNFVSGLFLICVLISTTNPSFSEEDVGDALHSSNNEFKEDIAEIPNTKSLEGIKVDDANVNEDEDGDATKVEGRSITQNTEENMAGLDKHSKPLRSIFMGIYKNYKSTYLGNKTLTEYKQTLRETMKNKQQQQQQNHPDQSLEAEELDENDDEFPDDGIVTEYPEDEVTTTFAPEIQEITTTATAKLSPNRKRKNSPKNSKAPKEKSDIKKMKSTEHQYNVGAALNLSLDMDNSIVKVNLDGESLKELVTGRWLSDNTEEGRSKKYEMVTRILPLFILPFLIQSAIVPFLVTKLKLLLIKSILVGKLAIFLLIISAFRNSNKQMQTYEVGPSYWAGEPSRRSELAAAASNMAYNGYRVEGKPAAWIN